MQLAYMSKIVIPTSHWRYFGSSMALCLPSLVVRSIQDFSSCRTDAAGRSNGSVGTNSSSELCEAYGSLESLTFSMTAIAKNTSKKGASDPRASVGSLSHLMALNLTGALPTTELMSMMFGMRRISISFSKALASTSSSASCSFLDRPPAKSTEHAPHEFLLDLFSVDFGWSFLAAADVRDFRGLLMGSIGDLQVDLCSPSIDKMAVTLTHWVECSSRALSNVDDFAWMRVGRCQTLITELARISADGVVTGDPIFLTRPSNVWRLGVRRFQDDNGWKILARFRQLWKSMPAYERDRIEACMAEFGRSTAAIKPVDPLARPTTDQRDAMFGDVVRQMGGWRSWEVGNLSSCQFLLELYHPSHYRPVLLGSPSVLSSAVRHGLIYPRTRALAKLGRLQLLLHGATERTKATGVSLTDRLLISEVEIAGRTVPIYEGLDESSGGPPISPHSPEASTLNLNAFCEAYPTSLNVNLIFKLRGFDVTFPLDFARLGDLLRFVDQSNIKRRPTKPSSSYDLLDLIGLQACLVIDRISVILPADDHAATFVLNEMNLVVRQAPPSRHGFGLAERIRRSDDLLNGWHGGDDWRGSHAMFANTTTAGPSILRISLLSAKGFEFSLSRGRSSHIGPPLRTIPSLTTSSSSSSSEKTVVFNIICTELQVLDDLTKTNVVREAIVSQNLFVVIKVLQSSVPQGLVALKEVVDMIVDRIVSFQQKVARNPFPAEDERIESSQTGDTPVPVRRLHLYLPRALATVDMLPVLRVEYVLLDSFAALQTRREIRRPRAEEQASVVAALEIHEIPVLLQMTKQVVRFITNPLAARPRSGLREAETRRASFIQGQVDNDSRTAELNIPIVQAHGQLAARRLLPRRTIGPSGIALKQNGPLATRPLAWYLDAVVSVEAIKGNITLEMIYQLLRTNDTIQKHVASLFVVSPSDGDASSSTSGSGGALGTSPPKVEVRYACHLLTRGVHVILLTPTSIMSFDSEGFRGYLQDYARKEDPTASADLSVPKLLPLVWRFGLRELSLSLRENLVGNARARRLQGASPPRLAYITADITIQNYRMRPPVHDSVRRLGPSERGFGAADVAPRFESHRLQPGAENGGVVFRVHQITALAVPAATTHFTRVYFYCKKGLREIRLETLNPATPVNAKRPPVSSRPDYGSLSIYVGDVVVCFPYSITDIARLQTDATAGAELGPGVGARSPRQDSSAFMLSVSGISVSLPDLHVVTARAKGITVRLIDQFDRTDPAHLRPNSHSLKNAFTLPRVGLCVFTRSSGMQDHLLVNADMEPFECFLSPNIMSHMVLLMSVWELEQLHANIGEDLVFASLANAPPLIALPSPAPLSPRPDNVEELNIIIDGRFVCAGGMVSLHSGSGQNPHFEPDRRMSRSRRESKDMDPLQREAAFLRPTLATSDDALGAATIKCPKLTVLLKHMPRIARQNLPTRLHVDMTLQPSDNVLPPDVAAFVNECLIFNDMTRFQVMVGSNRARRGSLQSPRDAAALEVPTTSRSVSCHFHIGTQRLTLSCSPFGKVVCVLEMQSADYHLSWLANLGLSSDTNSQTGRTPGSTSIGHPMSTLALTFVSPNLSVKLYHSFSQDEFWLGECKGLTVHLLLSSTDIVSESVSLLMQIRELNASASLRHLQDFVVFQRVWFKRRGRRSSLMLPEADLTIAARAAAVASGSTAPPCIAVAHHAYSRLGLPDRSRDDRWRPKSRHRQRRRGAQRCSRLLQVAHGSLRRWRIIC